MLWYHDNIAWAVLETIEGRKFGASIVTSHIFSQTMVKLLCLHGDQCWPCYERPVAVYFVQLLLFKQKGSTKIGFACNLYLLNSV